MGLQNLKKVYNRSLNENSANGFELFLLVLLFLSIFCFSFRKKVIIFPTPWRLAKFAPNLWKLSSYLAIHPHSQNCLDHQILASASDTLFYRFISEGGLWWHVSWSRWPPSSLYRQGWLGNRSFREISWEKFLGKGNYPPKKCETGDIILDINITRYPTQGLFLVGRSHPGWFVASQAAENRLASNAWRWSMDATKRFGSRTWQMTTT